MCSKGNGILKLKELLGIDSIAGIGDSYNELPMLDIVDTTFTFHASPYDIREKAKHAVFNLKEVIDILKEE